MSWLSSNRRERLPDNWDSLRLSVLRRDGFRCQIQGSGCCGAATDVDHIVAGDDHSLGNLRAACSRCHARKSSAEGNDARRKLRAARFRPGVRHPGVG